MRDISRLFTALRSSRFRSKFRLSGNEQKYFSDKGAALIRQHAVDIIRQRLAPAFPASDGKQTPWRGHPVFVAQHATATCCRGCLEKWHCIKRGQELSDTQIEYVVEIIAHWLDLQTQTPAAVPQNSEQLKIAFETHDDLLK